MRTATIIAVVLAVVATALAGVKEQSESRRLQYDIPRLERRRDLLSRRIRAAESDVARALSARILLVEQERKLALPQAASQVGEPAVVPGPAPGEFEEGESP